MAIGFDGPANWDGLDEAARANSSLDSDFCIIARPGGDTERYICGLLRLPVHGTESEFFQWIVWLSVSEASWDAYRAGFGGGTYPQTGCFAYLMHEIPGFEGSLALPANVWFAPDGLRPTVELQDGDHPLVKAQQQGIDLSQIERWAALMHRGV